MSQPNAEPVAVENAEVVIIFSKNCVVAYQWITYLTEILSKIFTSNDRPPKRVTSCVVESLVDCSTLPASGRSPLPPPTPPSSRFRKTDYQNVVVTEKDAERSSRQHAVRKTVTASTMQIVLLSKALLNHVSLHANDPLGTLLHPKRVLGLMLGIDEAKDITPLHRSALITFEYWPKVVMLDQNMESVTEFGRLAQSILCQSQPVAPVAEANLQPVRFKITPKKLRSGEERVSLILMETMENIHHLATVHIEIENQKPVHISKLGWLNPYVANFIVPKTFLERDIVIKVHLKVNNISWGCRELKCQSKLGEIAFLLSKCQLMGSPTEVMCQALNISPVDNEALDRALTANLEAAKISFPRFDVSQTYDNHRDEEFPTLLHFAARYGFKDMTWALLECLGAVQALYICNFHGFTPLQLAENHRHHVVTNILNSFIQVAEAEKSEFGQLQDDQPSNESDYVVMNQSTREKTTDSCNYDILPKPKPVCSTDCDNLSTPNNEMADDYVIILPNSSKNTNCTEDSEKDIGAVGGEETETDENHQRQKQTNRNQAIIPVNQEESVWPLQDAPVTLVVSRGSSPLSNWSSSDRSSVTSHQSHDSGTHFESSEERKVLINIRSDYDVPPTTVVVNSRFMMTSYDIPPPPVPLKNNVTRRPSNASIPSQSQLRRIATVSTSPKSSPRPPPRFRNQFETVELNPPTSQAILGEDLGRIVSIEEPECMEQRPIQLPVSPPVGFSNIVEQESDYMVMTPIISRKGVPSRTNLEGNPAEMQMLDDGEYISPGELNMPSSTLLSTFSTSRDNLTGKANSFLHARAISNSENQLPANHEDSLVSVWYSDTTLATSKPVPSPRLNRSGNITPPLPPRNKQSEISFTLTRRKN